MCMIGGVDNTIDFGLETNLNWSLIRKYNGPKQGHLKR